jgi:hypothetical protein
MFELNIMTSAYLSVSLDSIQKQHKHLAHLLMTLPNKNVRMNNTMNKANPAKYTIAWVCSTLSSEIKVFVERKLKTYGKLSLKVFKKGNMFEEPVNMLELESI